VNEILGDHNVDKQITDNKGNVSPICLRNTTTADLLWSQVAYLMADISDVRISEIREISDNLEALSCKEPFQGNHEISNMNSAHHDPHPLLEIYA